MFSAFSRTRSNITFFLKWKKSFTELRRAPLAQGAGLILRYFLPTGNTCDSQLSSVFGSGTLLDEQHDPSLRGPSTCVRCSSQQKEKFRHILHLKTAAYNLTFQCQCCHASTALHTEVPLFMPQVTQMATATERHQHIHITYLKPLLGLNKILAAFMLRTQGFIVFLRMTSGSRSCFTAWEQKSQLCFIKNFIYRKTMFTSNREPGSSCKTLQIEVFSPLATTNQLSYPHGSQSLSQHLQKMQRLSVYSPQTTHFKAGQFLHSCCIHSSEGWVTLNKTPEDTIPWQEEPLDPAYQYRNR